MIWLYAAQLALPAILIGWMLWLPARSGLGFILQAFGSFAALAVMALQGIWLLPPWWAPFVFTIALSLAVWSGLRRIRPLSFALPVTWAGWAAIHAPSSSTAAFRYAAI